MLKDAALNVTLPDILPELLMVMPPVLVLLVPLWLDTAIFRLLAENRFAATVPEFVKVAPFVLSLVIWMTELLLEPSAVMAPELLMETMPFPAVASPLPVPAE